jgi:hypothetical protein
VETKRNNTSNLENSKRVLFNQNEEDVYAKNAMIILCRTIKIMLRITVGQIYDFVGTGNDIL